MFGKQVSLFKLAGFVVKLDMSWVFLALLIAWSLAQGFFPTYYEGLPKAVYWWMGLAGVLGLFFSIVLHELSHSLVARLYGIPIRGITLFIFGGVAEMEEEAVSPKAEFLMAIAGPFASIVLAVMFFGLSVSGHGVGFPAPVVAVTRYLAYLNSVLAVFNAVPAFPLDGGRVLRAVLWQRTGNLRQATRTASRIGAGFGLLLIALGVLNVLGGNLVGGMWWFLIGLFVRSAAAGSYHQLLVRRALEGEPVRRFTTLNPVTVSPNTTVRELVEDFVYKHYFDLFPVIDNSQLVGCVNTRQIKQIPRDKWESVTVGQIASPCSSDNTIEADQDSVQALLQMQRTGNTRMTVVEKGRLVGIVSLKDMLRLLALKMDLESEN